MTYKVHCKQCVIVENKMSTIFKRKEKCIHRQRCCTDHRLPFTNVIYRTGYHYILERITRFLFDGISFFHETVSFINFQLSIIFSTILLSKPVNVEQFE